MGARAAAAASAFVILFELEKQKPSVLDARQNTSHLEILIYRFLTLFVYLITPSLVCHKLYNFNKVRFCSRALKDISR